MKTFPFLIIFIQSFFLSGQEILEMKSGHFFYGSVEEINLCELTFLTTSDRYSIPIKDINSISTTRADDHFRELLNACNEAESDVQLYHGKAFGHIVLGLAFGGFATLGAGIATPSPYKDPKTVSMSLNKEFFTDEKYLKCYRKHARNKNIGNTLIGWGAWIIIYLSLSGS